MRRGRGGSIGGCINFAKTVHEARGKAESLGWIIEADVWLGKMKKVEPRDFNYDTTFTGLYNEGYDSVHVKGVFNTFDEYIVYNYDQVRLLSIRVDL